MIDELLEYNRRFVEDGYYKQYATSKYPDKEIAIVTCMDTRLTVLLPAALGIKNGDVKIIKNAGGVVHEEYGEAMRSVLVAVYELGVSEIMIIGHTDCGAQHLEAGAMLSDMKKRGITDDDLAHAHFSGTNLSLWLDGFRDAEASVKRSMEVVTNHPLMPPGDAVTVRGFIIDSVTGKLSEVKP